MIQGIFTGERKTTIVNKKKISFDFVFQFTKVIFNQPVYSSVIFMRIDNAMSNNRSWFKIKN